MCDRRRSWGICHCWLSRSRSWPVVGGNWVAGSGGPVFGGQPGRIVSCSRLGCDGSRAGNELGLGDPLGGSKGRPDLDGSGGD